MTFDYESQTKNFYKNADVAERYHAAFTSGNGIASLRFQFIAARERKVTEKLLRQVPHGTVIDLPAGTGKMAPVYQRLGCDVLACDISEEMLSIAQETYADAHCKNVEFRCVDLEQADTQITGKVDAFVCIRLMHRVPVEVKRRMLFEISQLADYAVVSFAVDSAYQNLRRLLRKGILGGKDIGVETRQSGQEIEAMLEQNFVIHDVKPVSRLLSAERVYLLESKHER